MNAQETLSKLAALKENGNKFNLGKKGVRGGR